MICFYSIHSDGILQAANNPLALWGAFRSLPPSCRLSVCHSHGFPKLKIILPQTGEKLPGRGGGGACFSFLFFSIPKSWLNCSRGGFAGTEQEVELHSDNLLLHLWGAVRRGRNAHFPAALSDLQGSIWVGLFMGSAWEIIHLHDIFFHRMEGAVKCRYRFPLDTVVEIVLINNVFKWNHSYRAHRNVPE